MDLSFTPEEEAFREEARAWLEANVPASPLASMDTPDSFEQHRAWEATLSSGGWSAVWWPSEYGGQVRKRRGDDFITRRYEVGDRRLKAACP